MPWMPKDKPVHGYSMGMSEGTTDENTNLLPPRRVQKESTSSRDYSSRRNKVGRFTILLNET